MAQARFVDYSTSDHYQVLGLNRGASQAEIARAYKEKARQLHPDKNPDDKDAAELSFKRIADAYAVLRDPHKRLQYDQTGASRSYVSYDEAEHMWDAFCRNEGSSNASRREEPRDSEGRQKVILLVSLFALFWYAPQGLLPFVVAWLAATALQNHGNVVRIPCAMLAYMLASSALQWSQGNSYSAAPEVDLKDLHGLVGSNTGPSSLGLPRSGEELMMIDGQFSRVADPLGAERGDAQHGWEQRLADAMVNAINSGRCQVLLVFSRQGCPWCDRQLPVLRNAIKQRAAYISGLHQRAPPAASGQSPPSGATELDIQAPRVPLRVFIMDADEFPELTETFQIEGFPTTVAWVAPNGQPLLVPGFLDDQSLAEILRQPPPDDPPAAPSADVKPVTSLRANA